MQSNDMTFRIGGEAGQGIESGGAGFATALARGGLHVFGFPDYMSRVRGGHNFFEVRIAEEPLYGPTGAGVHLLMAMDERTIAEHWHEVLPGGGVLYDEGARVAHEEELRERGVRLLPVPLVQIATEVGNPIMANTGALAAAAGVTGYDLRYIEGVVRDNFRVKGDRVVQGNLEVARRGWEFAHERYASDFGFRVEAIDGAPRRMVMTGNQAFCMGALMGGCRFVAAYPMTPATGIIEWMAGHQDTYGIVTKHVEDEIAAICMAIGANHVGVRAMAATSGGGFALMVEAFGLAGMLETPLVVVEAQRPGPSTGMPTRTAQGDLLFVMNASQGEFLRIVIAPATTEEYFQAGWRAFNLAEKYQTPVVVLVDNFLANMVRTIPRADLRFEEVVIDRGELLTDEELDRLAEDYRRYAITESGISPRAIPGHPKGISISCSDEHDEYGHFDDEGLENRNRMVEKRLRKVDAARREMRPPTRYGPERAETTLVCWGSTYGPAMEAVDRLNADGGSCNMLHFADIAPLNVEATLPMLEGAGRLVAVEGNATAQFARYLRMETGYQVEDHVLRYDGRPLTAQYILDRVQ